MIRKVWKGDMEDLYKNVKLEEMSRSSKMDEL